MGIVNRVGNEFSLTIGADHTAIQGEIPMGSFCPDKLVSSLMNNDSRGFTSTH
jgi:hypothetical protein